jgi:predicted AAA+ superfamily ATPase
MASALQGRTVSPGTTEFGWALETYLMHEISAYADYRSGDDLAFWRSTSGYEVDFILSDHTAVEVKSTATVSPRDLKSLRALAEEKLLKRYLCVSLEPRPRTVDGVTIIPWGEFLEALWADEYR